MLIPIQCENAGIPEWALIELQGKIELQGDLSLHEDSLAVGTMQLNKTVRSTAIRTLQLASA